jgi:hypothetical protein
MTTLCGAETEANDLVTALIAGKDFTLPDVDLSGPEFDFPADDTIDPPAALTNELLTTKMVGGAGTFDVIMASISNHLKAEFEKSRITGEQYTKAYIELTAQSLQGAIQYLTVKDTAYWQAVAAQYQAKIAQAGLVESRVKLEIAKANLATARLEAANQEANYALTKIKVATEEVQYCTGKFGLDNILPQQLLLLTEQTESQRAQTMDTRMNGTTPVTGLMGKQKALYDQQITSYKRDAETKAIKLFTDAWITQKTIDEGLSPPTQFANTELNTILNRLRVNLNLDT